MTFQRPVIFNTAVRASGRTKLKHFSLPHVADSFKGWSLACTVPFVCNLMTHRSLSPDPIFSELHPVPPFTHDFSKIHFRFQNHQITKVYHITVNSTYLFRTYMLQTMQDRPQGDTHKYTLILNPVLISLYIDTLSV
jgi:hypothetical protein